LALRITRQTGSFLFALVVFGALTSGCEDVKVVAEVNGQAITRDNWNQRCQLTMSGYSQYLTLRSQMGRQAAPVGYYALDQLIQEAVLLQLAKEKGLLPTDKDVDDALARLVRKDASYLEKQNAVGRKRQYVKDEIRIDLARFNIQTENVEVTLKEVEDYIKYHKDEFKEPPTVRFSIIAVDTEEAKKAVDRDLATGVTFDLVARQYSIHESREQGGAIMQRIPLNRVEPGLREYLEKTPVFQTTPWIPAQQGWIKLKVDEKTEERDIAITEDVKTDLRDRLMLAKAEDVSDFASDFLDALNEAKVEIKDQYLSALWKQDQATRKEALKRQREQEKEAESAVEPTGTSPAPGPAGE
jgi:foldase protein PrsA